MSGLSIVFSCEWQLLCDLLTARPGGLNSLVGLISTLINVYTAQAHVFSVTAKVTTIVTSICLFINTLFFILYDNFALEKVRQMHHRETKFHQGHEIDSTTEKFTHGLHEPALEPGSVV
jgi:hypothetical protein